MNRRIHVTGIGIVSTAGPGAKAAQEAVRSPRPAAPSRRVEDALLEPLLVSPQTRRMARVSRFALAAAQEALRDGGLPLSADAPHDEIGVVCASTHLATQYGQEFSNGFLAPGKPMPGPIYFSNGCLNAASSHISLEYRLTGCNHNVVGGMNVGLHALGAAMRMLQDGPCSALLCVGCEELSEILLGAYAKFRLVPPMMPGEGAAALLLETQEHATRRGARLGAEIARFHTSHGPEIRRDVEGRGIARAVEDVARGMGIGLYASCANGTELDVRERNALKSILPSSTSWLSVKPALGEGFAFTSLAQAALLALELQRLRIPAGVACSYDRRGDVSAVLLRNAE